MASKDPQPSPPATGKGAPPAAPDKPPLDRTVRLLSHFERFAWDIGGVLALALALMTLLALLLPQLAQGRLLSWWVQKLQFLFGWGSVWVVSVTGVIGLWMLRRRNTGGELQVHWGRVIALEISAFASLALLGAMGGADLRNAEAGLEGGIVGWGLVELLHLVMAPFGLGAPLFQGLVYFLVFLLSAALGTGLLSSLATWAGCPAAEGTLLPEPGLGAVVSEAPMAGQETSPAGDGRRRKRSLSLPAQFRKNFRLAENEPLPAAPQTRDERLPPLEMLMSEQSARADERNINLTAGLIEKTLAEFGIPTRVVGFKIGPTVTQFAVEPGFLEKERPGDEEDVKRQKVRVAQIAALNRDLALALSAERLRIEAPVPGRPYVGIEVPNTRSTVVRLRPLLESEAYYKVNSPLAIALGKDVSGQPVVGDLGRMPHLLIAGTTGSGKSVCIAALTCCLVMNNTPQDLRLVMIDPKMVELVRFNGLPHLLGKVETDIERILVVLRWTVAEMDRRYKLLEATRSRNIDSYNRKARRRKGEEPLPVIVVMVDELADLMMSAPDQTEHNLVRLAQMARATGIHLVVATQRPSTDVVTGLIKANFPARISFAVASGVDSRVILDSQGAESLLGRGDMLFLQPEAAAAIRAQGAMVTDAEIERIITFWQKNTPEGEGEAVSPWEAMLEEEATLADRDDLVKKAIRLVQSSQRASASLLQRRLRIGYPRAARLIDELEEMGVIGPSQGGGREREVLISPGDDWEGDAFSGAQQE